MKRLRSVANVSVSRVKARQASTAAMNTQKVCLLDSRARRLRCSEWSIASVRVLDGDIGFFLMIQSGRFDGAGDEAGDLLGR
ncbi:hypothetical protein D3C87_1937000 [compost metagenome]